MLAVTVSAKFQVVLPRAVLERVPITVGQKMQVITIDRRIVLLPIETAQAARGFLAGIDTTVVRNAVAR
jgi:bifunctional DNA-binding transcriptional regulator/antitoxin component of YhaV-PrlF toxin-antitoxin module